MKWFYHLKIRTKLMSSFIFVALVATLIGFKGLSGMGLMMTAQDEIAAVRLHSIQGLALI